MRLDKLSANVALQSVTGNVEARSTETADAERDMRSSMAQFVSSCYNSACHARLVRALRLGQESRQQKSPIFSKDSARVFGTVDRR